jgi:hypothetical protein
VNRPDREWFAQLRFWLIGAVSWFALSTAGELIGNQANETEAGQVIGHYVLLAAVFVVPAFVVAWGVLSLRERKRLRSPLAADEIPPAPRLLEPPVWAGSQELCGRHDEVWSAVQLVRANGVVAVVGERDVGTSAVGRAVAQELIDHHSVDARATTRFDLRSRSTAGPDDAVATASRILPAYGIDEPGDDTALDKVAHELVGMFRASRGTLVLDNVSTPEQVAWLVREWPATGPRLVLVGETAVGDLVSHSVVRVDEMSIEDMRSLWRLALGTPVRRFRLPFTHRSDTDPALDELLRACFGRPGAVKVLAHEVARPGSTVTLEYLLAELQRDGPVEGTLERVWRALLENMRAGLSDDAEWLLSALAELPVTGLIEGAVAAMLGVSDPVALEELRVRSLVKEVDGRYRLPQEVRRAIQATTKEKDRRTVKARAVPALLRFYRHLCDLWAPRLEVDADAARRWFRVSEPSFRPLYQAEYPDGLLAVVVDDLCAIADALARWYVRERLSTGLFTVHEGLHDLVLRVGWLDLAALAAIRKATAQRMVREFGQATGELDRARALLEQVPNPRVHADLDVRERMERALLAVDRGTGQQAVFEDLSQLHATSPVLLINLAVLCLGRNDQDTALEHLLRAEELAQDTGDLGAEAHSVELQGVVLSHHNPAEAVRAWQLARATFARIGEKQGEARCLQHLGTAALKNERAAGQLLHGHPEPVDDPEQAQIAKKHLEQARTLRKDQSKLLDEYIEEAHRRLNEDD